MIVEKAFQTFLSEIRPTSNQKKDLKTGHSTLRDRLNADEKLKKILVTDFLQGSYRRSTAVRPKGDKRSDVDIIVVTNLSEDEHTPEEAMKLFEPFLNEHYKGKWRAQDRSYGIELSYVDLDLVITSAPKVSEKLLKSDAVRSDDELEMAEDWKLNEYWMSLGSRMARYDAEDKLRLSEDTDDWKTEPLRIPDRKRESWNDTHPLEQIRWTRDKNKKTNRHFINVVKAIKWWRLEKADEGARPKGFPLERIIGECCPDYIESIAEGVTKTLEDFVSRYKADYILKTKPFLKDYGVPSHDVLKSLEVSDFLSFYEDVEKAAITSRKALDSSSKKESHDLWRELFGSKFPEGGDDDSRSTGFTAVPEGPADPTSKRFA